MLLKYNVSLLVCISLLCSCSLSNARRRQGEKKKEEGGTFFGAKAINKMTYAELKEKKEQALKRGNIEQACEFAEKMIPLCTEMQVLGNLTLELADLFSQTENLVKAEQLYKDFCVLYPGSSKKEYALYKTIVCCSKNTLDDQRDQSKTREAVELAESFLRTKNYGTYTREVKVIYSECLEKLLRSELNIIDSYLKMGRYNPAKHRLELVEKEFGKKIENIEPILLSVECTIAEYEGNKDKLKEKQHLLAEKFPSYTTASTKLAARVPTKSFIDRF